MNKKTLIYTISLSVIALTLVLMLIFPLGLVREGTDNLGPIYSVLCFNNHEFDPSTTDSVVTIFVNKKNISSPFTLNLGEYTFIFVWQTIVFPILLAGFIVLSVLFTLEFLRNRRPTKAERLQAQIDELQKQVNELKNKD